MPRTLPWLSSTPKKISGASAHSLPTKGKRAATPSSDLVDGDLNPTVVSSPARRALHRTRTPSTSPPRVLTPPEVEYMHEGFSADDVWMMVEDEFLATAQLYTRHLHQAEYVKLRKLARSRGQTTIQEIKRSTDRTTEQDRAVQLKLEADRRLKRIKGGLKSVGVTEDDRSEDEDEYLHDTHLAGLMASENVGVVELSALTKPKSSSRAAAGFTRSPEKKTRFKQAEADDSPVTEDTTTTLHAHRKPNRQGNDEDHEDDDDNDDDTDDDTDDLDEPVRQTHSASVLKHSIRSASPTPYVLGDGSRLETHGRRGMFKQPAQRVDDEHTGHPKTSNSKTASGDRDATSYKSTTTASFDTVSRRMERTTASEYLAKRREAQQQKEQEKRKTEKFEVADDVPTWLV